MRSSLTSPLLLIRKFFVYEKMDETGQNFEEDPAAAFLARERDQLAGIDDDTLIISVPGVCTISLSNLTLKLTNSFSSFLGYYCCSAYRRGDSTGRRRFIWFYSMFYIFINYLVYGCFSLAIRRTSRIFWSLLCRNKHGWNSWLYFVRN